MIVCLILAGCGEKVSLNSSTVDPSAGSATVADSSSGAKPQIDKTGTELAKATTDGASLLPVVDDRLSLQVELDDPNNTGAVDFRRPLRVVLTNNSNQSIRITHPDHRKGYDRLSLQFTNSRTGTQQIATRSNRAGRNAAGMEITSGEPGVETIDIARGERVFFEVVLGRMNAEDREWTGVPVPNSGDPLTVVAHFESKANSDDSRARIWTGKLSSEPVLINLIAAGMDTPTDYLASGFAERAIELIAAEPGLLSTVDNLQRTPLHYAALGGLTKAVEWLLDHEADVNAVDHEGQTPLHLAQNSEIVGLILQKNPDLTIREKSQGYTPLQRAVMRLNDPARSAQMETWRQIVALYVNAGAEIDVLSAIYLDDLARVQVILKAAPDLADEFQKQCPLRLAAALGRLQICRYLIEEFQVDVNSPQSGHGLPIIKDALPHPQVVQLLIDSGADLKTRINQVASPDQPVEVMCDDATPLHYAARDGVPESLTALMNAGVDPFATARNFIGGRLQPTALEVAAYYGRADNCLAIVKHARFTAADATVRQAALDDSMLIAAPVFWLTQNANRADVFQVLLDHGADSSARVEQATVMQIAARQVQPGRDSQNAEIIRAMQHLVKHGAELDLYSAVAIGDTERVKELLNESPDLAASRSDDGYPALHLAVDLNHAAITMALLKAGCDVEIRNESRNGVKGGTAMHCAVLRGRNSVKQLFEAGATVNAVSDQKSTPLHHAAKSARVRTTRWLVENGALVDAQDDHGKTPLDWYRENCRNVPEIERILRKRDEQAAK